MKEELKKTKCFVNYHEELLWLEGMALEGWFLTDISLGVRYTFERGEPRKVVYDIDRLDRPNKTTLEDIKAKEIFTEMASEMGWKEAAHDETMTYYFVKDYEPDGINEINSEEEERKLRAEKFVRLLNENKDSLLSMVLLVVLTDIVMMIIQDVSNDHFLGWYNYFVAIYVAFFTVYSICINKLTVRLRKELSMSREQWMSECYNIKKERKIIFKNKKVIEYLEEMAREGWILSDATKFKYMFKKEKTTHLIYTIDSSTDVKLRHREINIKDTKDWYGLNIDWQIQSLNDAKENGWSYVCSINNEMIIYSGIKGETSPLECEGEKKGMFLKLNKAETVILILSVIAFIAGFVAAMLCLD